MAASGFRSWTWTRIDGRNVLAMPTRDEVHLYDSEDFILLDKIAPSGHRSYIHAVRWSAFHGKLASISATQLIVHAPQLIVERGTGGSVDSDGHVSDNERVRFVRICDFDLVDALTDLRSVAFSRCADLLLFGGTGGVGMLDIRASAQLQNAEDLRLSGFGDAAKKLVWRDTTNAQADVVKVSPCSFVFASFKKEDTTVRVWRMGRDTQGGAGELARRVIRVDDLEHPEPVAYASWKPATTQMHAATEYDGTHKARWFEPQRMLLTCTKSSRTIRIWVEKEEANAVTFLPALVIEPTLPLRNVRWVLSKNRNISEEKFQIMDTTDEQQIDWVSGVDDGGVLHLYQLLGIASKAPRVKDTELRIKVNGEGDAEDGSTALPKLIVLEEICVMAYFSQNYFGLPSKFDIVLQRSDGILLSYIITIGKNKHAQVKKKSWYRSHLGSIAALAAHPSLPLMASVDEHYRHSDNSYGNEILIFWVSFSAFSAESRLVPSGVLECPRENGPVLCVQWIPTLHFDATPLLLVAYCSGVIDVYGRAANARDVLSSPRNAKKSSPTRRNLRHRSPSLAPWTFFDYTTGQSGIEYEVAIEKEESQGLGFAVEFKEEALRVSAVLNHALTQISIGDEVIAINATKCGNKRPEEFQLVAEAVQVGLVAVLRFRSQAHEHPDGAFRSPTLMSQAADGTHGDDDCAHAAQTLHKEFLASAESEFSLNAGYVHAGSVSMYGGWRQLLSSKVAASLDLVCVTPVYADDGEYIPGTVLVFGLSGTHPGTLRVWKGLLSGSSAHEFSLLPLHINDAAVLKKEDITSIAGERDYRQRAFTSTKRTDSKGDALNSLVFVGDATGAVHHWRCRVSDNIVSFAMMSTCSVETGVAASALDGSIAFNPRSFFRRGYFNSRRSKTETGRSIGIRHIEVDDPNRIAVLHASHPDELHVFEGESGLGMMRLEETIAAEGRGRILGFCWCNAHVEFNVDALAVQYESSIVIYQYDMNQHRWVQVGNDVVTALATFDCTRDSSALLIGGGHVNRNVKTHDENGETEEIPIVLGKWDEPGNLLQQAMDWKAPESPQKLPVWHPYVVITTLFGMHARVGVKDTTMASDSPVFEFSKAFKDAVQMLKLLAKVVEDDASTRLSATTGVLAYSVPSSSRRSGKMPTLASAAHAIMFIGAVGHRDSIGRYSTAVHTDSSLNKAENLFAEPRFGSRTSYNGTSGVFGSTSASDKLETDEAAILTRALDAVLQIQRMGKVANSFKKGNPSILFGSFQREQLLEMKAVLHFVNAVQSLGFELDASAADLGAKRYFAMFLFGRSLQTVLEGHSSVNDHRVGEDESQDEVERLSRTAYLREPPSSALLWAMHSSAQSFLIEHCIQPQPTWDELRPMWLGLWVRDIKDVRAIVERLAKSTYAKTRDAMDVTLHYIALGKKNILGALAKMSKIETNKNLANFLENDFSQERWSNAAIKNAYSLLSKKQYETAAAFFLLCEPPRLQEALRLLAVRLQDPSLALLVSRLVEHRMSDTFSVDFISSVNSSGRKEITPAGETTKWLLEHDLIPLFRERQDRWLESASLWWLEDFEQACTILLPQSQPIDINLNQSMTARRDTFMAGIMGNSTKLGVVHRSRSATYFFVNLTSIPIYFQYLHTSGIDAPLVTWAIKKILLLSSKKEPSSVGGSVAAAAIAARKHRLASTADIEHAFAFAAYVCKRSGMSDTSVIEMLQARHLVNLHAKVDLRQQPQLTSSSDLVSPASPEAGGSDLELPTSPRMTAFMRDKLAPPSARASSPRLGRQSSFSGDRQSPQWASSPRRMSELSDSLDFGVTSPRAQGINALLQRSSSVYWSLSSDKSSPSLGSSPWLKAQIADLECRRWSSSAFVGKVLGIRVAREMITHFRAELDVCFRHFVEGMPLRAERHSDFLEELSAPLCQQFQVDRTYVLEAALAVMQPHAYLHIAEICFLLSVLGRSATMTKWIQYVALSMLKSCGTFASCRITQAIYRDWESLTIQLCYILHLDAQGQIDIPYQVVAQVAVAVRTGCVFLGWSKQQWPVVHQAITLAFYSRAAEPGKDDDANEYFAELSNFAFKQNLELIRSLLQSQDQAKKDNTRRATNEFSSGFGYLFLRTVAAHLHGDDSSIFDSSSQPDGELENSESEQSYHEPKLHKMYSLILMVSVLRTLYARAQVFLLGCRGAGQQSTRDPIDEMNELDISSSLFTPRKLWKPLTENPLDGLRRWYSLIESHLRCEFDYSVREVTCICGLYGLDGRSADLAARVQERISKFEDSLAQRVPTNPDEHEHDRGHHTHHLHFGFHHHVRVPVSSTSTAVATHQCRYQLDEILEAIGIGQGLHRRLLQTSDDYILLLMKHPKYGVPLSRRRFRLEPRVHVKCFLLQDVFEWFSTTTKIFEKVSDARHFLSRCCKQRKLRLLVKHRGQNPHHFPAHHHHKREDDQIDEDADDGKESSSPPDIEPEVEEDEEVLRALMNQAMMFVDPWEVEAEKNASKYMHHSKTPLHVELGWDRLSPICTAVVDEIAKYVFHGDTALCEMWQSTRGEGWLITSIIQYQLDGVHSHRSGHLETKCVFEEDEKVPYLVEVHSRSQRNALFQEVGLPHRFVGAIKVKLLSAKNLIPVKWIEYFSDPYVFLAVSSSEEIELSYDTWSIQTYRSRCAPGGTNPMWNHPEEDEFSFRFAIPTHKQHLSAPGSSRSDCSHPQCLSAKESGARDPNDSDDKDSTQTAERMWNSAATSASGNSKENESIEVLESLFQHSFTGPPLFLHCAIFHKTKVFAHHFMGRGKVALNPLTSGHPIDVWIPLEGVESGSLHVEISLSFQLMCSSAAGAHSASSYEHHSMYDSMSEHSQSSKSTHDAKPASLLDDEMPPLPPHLTPPVPRSSGSRF